MRARTRRRILVAALVAAAALLPLAAVTLWVPAPSSSSQLGVGPDYENLNASPSGHILFGSPLPVAEILPTANATEGATLALNHLLEIAPNASDPEHPTVVAEAAPEALETFNSTVPLHGATTYFNLIATLPVYPAKTDLWMSGTTVIPTSDIARQAILDVNYSLATGTDHSPGVLVSWAVSGWPWVNASGDELALEYVVQVDAGTGFEYCTSAPSSEAADATCATEPLAQGQAVWSADLTALKGNGPEGSVAWVSWASQVVGSSSGGGSSSGAAPVSAGAYFEAPGTSALVISGPDGGASSVTGSTLFLLSPGTVGQLAASLVGNLPVYGGAAALFAALAGTGMYLSRRRDQAIARELAE
jgi:hypothetical protein